MPEATLAAEPVATPRVAPAPVPSAPPVPSKPERLVSLDAYRGLIMIFMASSGFGFAQMAQEFHRSDFWRLLGFHTSHVPWVGGSAWDMIQPAFMFMVGVALPFSLARRTAEGQAYGRQFLHAAWRSLVLVALAVFLASVGRPQPNYIFTNVLGQIGLGYTFAFLLVGRGLAIQISAIGLLLMGYWAAFAFYPIQWDTNPATMGIRGNDASDVLLPGFFAHWNKNMNFAATFDRWFLNQFPTEKEFVFNTGGYQTLNFIPSLGTILLGVIAGEALQSNRDPRARLTSLAKVGTICLGLGIIAGVTICPIVKRIWTPSWALFSGGIVIWILAAFYWIVDVRGWKGWTKPLVIVGMNSIAIYLLHSLLAGWIANTLKIYLGKGVFDGTWGPVLQRTSVLLVLWLVCWWMYRRKIFLKI